MNAVKLFPEPFDLDEITRLLEGFALGNGMRVW